MLDERHQMGKKQQHSSSLFKPISNGLRDEVTRGWSSLPSQSQHRQMMRPAGMRIHSIDSPHSPMTNSANGTMLLHTSINPFTPTHPMGSSTGGSHHGRFINSANLARTPTINASYRNDETQSEPTNPESRRLPIRQCAVSR